MSEARAMKVAVDIDVTPARAEVYQLGRWVYRIRVYTKEGWLVQTEERYGRRRAERRADELLAEAPRSEPQPVYVSHAAPVDHE